MYQVTTVTGNSFPYAFDAAAVRSRAVSDLSTTDVDPVVNPLKAIMAGMACFFGVAAFIIAWS
jgi:hypothetical protein